MLIYYIEVNVMCIVILLLFRMQLKNTDTTSADKRILDWMIWANVIFCFSDMFAGIFRGKRFLGAVYFIEISNMVYFEGIVLVSFLWNVYVHTRLTKNPIQDRRKIFLHALPMLVFTLVVLTNPFTNILFRIDENNLYERNWGVYLHWGVVWTYFLIPTFQTIGAYTREKSRLKKQEIEPMLYFTIAPMIASVIQMFFYGVTSTQVGITISLIMICLKSQDAQILTDALTGINNRRGFDYYLSNHMQHNQNVVYSLIMIDVDHFKHINDEYGHMVGDLTLQNIAEALKRSCKEVNKRLHLCRFGGDEFVILGMDCNGEEIETLKKSIHLEVELNAKLEKLPCVCSVSIGVAQGPCYDEKDLKNLLNQADQAMYKMKSERRK